MPKQLPPATSEDVFPPNLKHRYFESASDHPFRHRAEKFELVNAWWLAESSLLAYAEPDFAVPIFKQAGLTAYENKLTSGHSTQVYVAHNDNFVIAAFRGTQVFKANVGKTFPEMVRDVVADIYADGKFSLVESGQGGNTHRGFKEALDEVWNELLSCLNRLKTEKPDRTIWLTGHSLGAALATLAADRYGHVQGLYTFGSPFVGDEEFAQDYFVNTYRFTNNNDVVARVPPAGLYLPPKFPLIGSYHHVGQLKYISSEGTLHDNPSISSRLHEQFLGRYRHLIHSIGSLRSGWVWELPLDSLNDHAPLYYALRIWNAYERELIGEQ